LSNRELVQAVLPLRRNVSDAVRDDADVPPGSRNAPWSWGATAAEVDASYPCDGLVPGPVISMHLAVDIEAAPEVVFRWLCQLKAAPYSYDFIDNWGRRSPRTLTPGTEHLTRGERWMIFRIVDFEPDVHITGEILPGPGRVFGRLALTYLVRPRGAGARLVVRINCAAGSGVQRLALTALAWGDLVMMRKQLLTIKARAEGR